MVLSKGGTSIPVKRGRGDLRASSRDLDERELGVTPTCVNDPKRVGRAEEKDEVDWRDVALRLKADMDNYRKRQKRWAGDEIAREKAVLLSRFLEVMDNLEHALAHVDSGDPAHQGLQMAYDSMLSLLLREGVERVFARGRVFDPTYHEAVATVPGSVDGADDMRVVDVVSPGYRLGDRVLRPAKVVVAKQMA
jgi:molecular chaperone GrpE